MKLKFFCILIILQVMIACQTFPELGNPTSITPIIIENLPSNTPLPSATYFTFTPSPTQETTGTLPSTSTPTKITVTPTSASIPEITLLFTGVIVPARCVQAALDKNGNPDYPYEEVKELLAGADLAIGTFNATMSDQVEHTGCLTTWQLVGSPDNADALGRAGFDAMGVATNHIKDCGLMKSWCDTTFFDTLSHLNRVGIKTVGAGENLEAALKPIVFEIEGVKFGIVSLGDSKMSETVFAQVDHPGIAPLTEENIKTALESARAVSDVVIAMPHWGSEDIIIPNWIQREQAQILVREGADLVVGNHTHVVQAIQTIDDVQVFYGLGNFVFDQPWSEQTKKGKIAKVIFTGREIKTFTEIPIYIKNSSQPDLVR